MVAIRHCVLSVSTNHDVARVADFDGELIVPDVCIWVTTEPGVSLHDASRTLEKLYAASTIVWVNTTGA